MKNTLWSKDYLCIIGINFLIYVVHFQLMLWSTSYALDTWHVGIGTAGLASGIFIVGALIARIPTGRYIDFLGRRRLFLLGTFFFFLLSLLYMAAPGIDSFMTVRFLHGLAFGAASTAASTIAAALIPVKRMGSGIGYYTLGVTLASAVGPFVAMYFVNLRDFYAGAVISGVIAAVILFLSAAVRVPERVVSEAERVELHHWSLDAFFARRALGIAFVAFLGGICYSTVLSYLGAYADTLGLSAVGGAYFFLCFALTSFLSRPVTGYLLDRCGGDIVIYPSLVLLVVSMITLASANSNGVLLLGGLLLGAGYGTLTAACHALSIHCALANQLGIATSTYFVLLDLGIGVGPYLLGHLVPEYGFSMVYLAAGMIALFGIHFYYMQLGRTGRFSAERMEKEKEEKLRLAHERN